MGSLTDSPCESHICPTTVLLWHHNSRQKPFPHFLSDLSSACPEKIWKSLQTPNSSSLLFSSDSALIPLYFLDLLYILYFTSPSLSQLRSDYSFTAPVNLLTFYPRSFSQTRTKYFSIISTETFRLKYFLVFRNIFYWDFMLCIKLWRENWWSCFLSIQCFSFFTPRNKHENQVVLPLLPGVTPAGPRHPSHSPLCGGVRGSISVPAVPSPALHNRIIWRKYPGLNTKCPISKEGKGDWIGRKTELDKDTAISITNTEDSSEAIGQNKDYIHPQLVWVQAPHLKMSSEVYKWCQGGGGWVAAALLFLNNF